MIKLNKDKPLYIEVTTEIMNQCIGGHNCDFEYDEIETEITYITDGENTYKIYQLETESGSGWCTATEGVCKESDHKVNAQYKLNEWSIKKGVMTDYEYIVDNYSFTISDGSGGDVILVDSCGGDGYYPCGSVKTFLHNIK